MATDLPTSSQRIPSVRRIMAWIINRAVCSCSLKRFATSFDVTPLACSYTQRAVFLSIISRSARFNAKIEFSRHSLFFFCHMQPEIIKSDIAFVLLKAIPFLRYGVTVSPSSRQLTSGRDTYGQEHCYQCQVRYRNTSLITG
ncbi:hypothetical protein OD522_004897 [Salmonella enterica]|nr:hypothetical protein [Salmonella enterica]EJA5857510.1 hypothetical protein [Salmonella enterica]EJF5731581.1 hypothetical protein [Salmonella enterica]EJU3354147.1 hypothetical protein [Salmonella enterica]EJX4304656.1 hypothetical protein [Salmonella enterica]